LDVHEPTDIRISPKRIKYKIKGENKWHSNKVTNFDEYREPTYKALETLLKNMFINVKMVEEEVPLICLCEQNNELRYFPYFPKVSVKDRILVA
jgi:hypothetical protein